MSAKDPQLTPEQAEAAHSSADRILIRAGAGTGKTRTLTARVAHLIERGAAPDRIILATFTQRAARVMTRRVEQLLGPIARRLRAGTFHHLALRVMRNHGHALGYGPQVRVVEGEQRRRWMADACAEVGLEGRSFRPERLSQILGLAVAAEAPLAQVLAVRAPSLVPRLPAIDAAFAGYTRMKVAANAMDFDDLLLGWRSLLVDPEIGARLRSEVDHVLVDELQDTSRIQASIAHDLADGRGLCAVGDDAQSIYGFRGAAPDNLERFEAAASRVYPLTLNFRSTPEIVAVANRSLLASGGPRHPLRAQRASGPRPVIVEALTREDEAAFVAQRISEIRDEGITLNDIAILYRTHAQAHLLRAALDRQGLPHLVRHDDEPPRAVQMDLADAAAQPEAWNRPETGAVTLSSIHRAKGLEWDAVFVTGLSQGSFPSPASSFEDGGIHEERRLFHVAVTRARQQLYLTGAGPKSPSPFVFEITGAEGLVEKWELA